jgi:carbamoyl-phosphate synthase large subunit
MAMGARQYRILTEASGSLTAGYLIEGIRAAGHKSVASDIDPRCFGSVLADDFILMPRADAPGLWEQVERAIVDKRVDLVVPSLDEMLEGWSVRKAHFERLGIRIVISDPRTVAICQDKWLTHEFFVANGIPSPATSLQQEHALVKPRRGRGAAGVRVTREPVDMQGMISQELLSGTEYTVDVFCDAASRPVYIVPRRRVHVRDGKSTAGVVEDQPVIRSCVEKICSRLPFIGPINVQCFLTSSGDVRFVEINPRIAGGMALSFAATENWFDLIVRNLLGGEPLVPKPVRFGLEMRRYYAEVFVPPG